MYISYKYKISFTIYQDSELKCRFYDGVNPPWYSLSREFDKLIESKRFIKNFIFKNFRIAQIKEVIIKNNHTGGIKVINSYKNGLLNLKQKLENLE